MSHILLTYHVEIPDLLTVTNYIRQNLTANFSESHSCTMELPSGILLSFYLLPTKLYLLLYSDWSTSYLIMALIPYHSHLLLLLNHVVIVVNLCCVEGLMEDRCIFNKHSR